MCRVLRGHRGSVLSLCSLGGLLLSGGRDNIIRVWDMDALVCRRTLAGHRDDVMCIAGLGLEPPPGASADPSQPRDTGCSQVGEYALIQYSECTGGATSIHYKHPQCPLFVPATNCKWYVLVVWRGEGH